MASLTMTMGYLLPFREEARWS
ncbi:hypothetical protein CCACVL1_19960 [Corchorus capsularis]|uniref:Uncharacterized protein n=1 Tax=Corchorus capsularis TaxID=210143 RepID=A0A1R3HDN2_COCAP|nr:hypothetical protein CCACVL1_19960 [Corchorus capsularis]